MVVNTNFGLGETVVAGECTPDTFIWNRVDKILVEKVIGKKELCIFQQEGGGT